MSVQETAWIRLRAHGRNPWCLLKTISHSFISLFVYLHALTLNEGLGQATQDSYGGRHICTLDMHSIHSTYTQTHIFYVSRVHHGHWYNVVIS